MKKTKQKTKISWRRFFEIINIFSIGASISKQTYKRRAIIRESIYPFAEETTLGEYCKKFNWVHGWFKIKVFVPGLMLMDKLIGKNFDREVKDTWYNKNLKIFAQSWDEALDVISKYMHAGMRKHRAYLIVKRMALTIILNDTITREFMNVFMHQIAFNMQNAYKGHKEVYHVFYMDKKSYNPVYFTMVKAIMEDQKHPRDVIMEHAKKVEKMVKQKNKIIRTATPKKGIGNGFVVSEDEARVIEEKSKGDININN